ncbi:MAG: hypothetical protein QM756_13785 [Polyangiaceae bacterium]
MIRFSLASNFVSRALIGAAIAATASLSMGCSDDGAKEDGDTEYVEGPLYLVSTSVLTNDSATSYLTTVKSLDAGPKLDLKNAVEFGGGSRAYGQKGADVVYVTSSESPTLTEVTIKPSGMPLKGRVLNLTNYGITGTTGGNVHHFISATKAYFVSQETLEVVVWNPQAMEVIKTIPLGLTPQANSAGIVYYPRPILVGDELLVISSDYDDNDVAQPSVITIVDTGTDTVVSSKQDPRCHSLLSSGVDANGDRYFATDGYSVAVHHMAPDVAPAPCMLRIKAGEKFFDQTWSRSFADELGTDLWTGVTPGADGTLFVQAIPGDTPSVEAAEDAYSITIATPWTWYSLSSPDAAPKALSSDFLTTPPLFPAIEVGDTSYVSLWDDTDTTLVDLSSSATPQKRLVVPGFVYNIVQVR